LCHIDAKIKGKNNTSVYCFFIFSEVLKNVFAVKKFWLKNKCIFCKETGAGKKVFVHKLSFLLNEKNLMSKLKREKIVEIREVNE
jgi:hypothetical protein